MSTNAVDVLDVSQHVKVQSRLASLSNADEEHGPSTLSLTPTSAPPVASKSKKIRKTGKKSRDQRHKKPTAQQKKSPTHVQTSTTLFQIEKVAREETT